VRVAVLGAPGPGTARPPTAAERVASRAAAGKGIVDVCGLFVVATGGVYYFGAFLRVYALGTVASHQTGRTRDPWAILKLHDTMSDFCFLHVPLAAEYAHVFFLPEEALRYQCEIGTELAALWSTALVLAQNAVSILRH